MLLLATGVRKEFANEVILDGAELRLDRRERVALIGRNGAGKSTFVKILTGDLQPDGGSVQWARGAKIGYLSQNSTLPLDKTVYEVAEQAQQHLVDIEKRLTELEAILEQGSPTEEDVEEYAMLRDHFDTEGGHSLEINLKVVLNKMGFDESEFDKLVGKLSGGERTRLLLAQLLLEEPEVLILDEPTNHLDLEAVEWLEGWIRHYHGAVLLISHDRRFLQATADRVVELRDGLTKSYPGNFDKYLVLRQEDEARTAEVARRQAQQMDKLDEFVRRFMNSQRTAQARGRLKQLEKLKASAVTAPKAEGSMKASLKVTKRSGDIVADAKKLTMTFGAETLFKDLSWTVRWGDRWGIIGLNGAGKSTLVKILLGRLAPTAGEVRLGSNVEVGYFTQDAESLDHSATPLETMHFGLGMTMGEARNLLGRFLISGDDATRPIKTLSGGERNKVQLAVLAAQNPNVLVLDEPTNHLDMPSREALAEVLQEYVGTLILVSHDRWLLETVTKSTLDMRGQEVIEFGGSFDEYRTWRAKGSPSGSAPKKAQTAVAVIEEPAVSPRELSKRIAKLEKDVIQYEEEVVAAEELVQLRGKVLEEAPPEADFISLAESLADANVTLEVAMNRWEETSKELDGLRKAQSGEDAGD
jgi:ATP-binding cassette subfamily F protein 3